MAVRKSKLHITLVHEGRPALKLCKSPGAESTVKKKNAASRFVMDTACFGSFQFPGGSLFQEEASWPNNGVEERGGGTLRGSIRFLKLFNFE